MYKLLIVEDEEEIRKGLVEHIDWNKLGFFVVASAEDGDTAIRMVEKYKPDAMLVDIVMPNMSGLELIGKVYKDYPAIKSIILSGYSNFEYAQKSMEYGVVNYLLKPTGDEDIKRVFNSLKETLDGIHNIKNQFEAMEQMAKESQHLMHEIRLKDLLKESVSNQAWKNAIEQGLISSPQKYQSVTIIKANKEIDGSSYSLSNYFFKQTARKWFKDNGYDFVRLLSNDDGTLVLIFLTDNENISFIHSIVKNFAEFVKTTILNLSMNKVYISAGTGLPYLDFDAISKSYELAKGAAAETFFRGYSLIIYDQHKTKDSDNQKNRNEFTSSKLPFEIIKQTLSASVSSFNTCIDEYTKLITKLKNDDQEMIMLNVIELVMSFVTHLNDMDIDTKDIFTKNTHKQVREIIMNKTHQHLNSYLKQLCLKISQVIKAYYKKGDVEIMQIAKEYIGTQYTHHIKLETMCALTYLSQSAFCSQFKQYTGCTFVEYLNLVRIEHAKQLLSMPMYKIYEVAFMTGFNDFRHLNRTMKKHEGVTPREYRSKVLEKTV